MKLKEAPYSIESIVSLWCGDTGKQTNLGAGDTF